MENKYSRCLGPTIYLKPVSANRLNEGQKYVIIMDPYNDMQNYWKTKGSLLKVKHAFCCTCCV